MAPGPTSGEVRTRGWATIGTLELGYPLLLCLGKGLVVILSYALTAEQPDPCGPEPYSPGKWPGPAPRLGKVRWRHVSRGR